MSQQTAQCSVRSDTVFQTRGVSTRPFQVFLGNVFSFYTILCQLWLPCCICFNTYYCLCFLFTSVVKCRIEFLIFLHKNTVPETRTVVKYLCCVHCRAKAWCALWKTEICPVSIWAFQKTGDSSAVIFIAMKVTAQRSERRDVQWKGFMLSLFWTPQSLATAFVKAGAMDCFT